MSRAVLPRGPNYAFRERYSASVAEKRPSGT